MPTIEVLQVRSIRKVWAGFDQLADINCSDVERHICSLVDHGFTAPIVIDKKGRVLGRAELYAAALCLNIKRVPVIVRREVHCLWRESFQAQT